MSDIKEGEVTETGPAIEETDVTEQGATIAQVDVTGNEVDQP